MGNREYLVVPGGGSRRPVEPEPSHGSRVPGGFATFRLNVPGAERRFDITVLSEKSKKKDSVEILNGICKNALLGLRQSLPSPPHACGISPVAMYYLYSCLYSDTGNTAASHTPPPPRGQGWLKEGAHNFKDRISTEQIFLIIRLYRTFFLLPERSA